MIFRTAEERAICRQELAGHQGGTRRTSTISAHCIRNKHGKCDYDLCCCICHESIHAEARSAREKHERIANGQRLRHAKIALRNLEPHSAVIQ